MESRIEEGLREIGAALTETLRTAAADVARASRTDEPQGPAEAGEPIRALATQIDERLQAIAVRIDRLEDAVRTVASRAAGRDGSTKRLDEIAQALTRLATQQQRGMARLAQFQQQGMARLAHQQRAELNDFAQRTGKGIVAVSRKVRDDLAAAIERLERTNGNGHGKIDDPIEAIGDIPSIPEAMMPAPEAMMPEPEQPGIPETITSDAEEREETD
ncbi:MAG TPA: hypothetical protein VG602_04495 [Actinomycetota bacterium]|nr:hypothetical protein [Actinomycetota bacterium]